MRRFRAIHGIAVVGILVTAIWLGIVVQQWTASAAAPPKFKVTSEMALVNTDVVTASASIAIYSGVSPNGTLVYSSTSNIAPAGEWVMRLKDIASISSPFVGYGYAYYPADVAITAEYRAHAKNPNSNIVHNIQDTAGTFVARWMSGTTTLRQDGPFTINGDQQIDLKTILSNPPQGYDDILLASTTTAQLEVFNAAGFPLLVK